nr:dephospho-CoA kinase [Desulfobacterales bacterium]
WQAVAAHFGAGGLKPDGQLNREKLAAMVFHDRRLKEDLERIIHPFVFRQMAAELTQMAAKQPGAVVILDIPLLIESGLHESLPTVVLVHVPEAVQRARLIRRDGLTAADARARIRAQMPIDAKRAYADVIIDNSGSLAATRRQTLALSRRLHATGPSSRSGSDP